MARLTLAHKIAAITLAVWKRSSSITWAGKQEKLRPQELITTHLAASSPVPAGKASVSRYSMASDGTQKTSWTSCAFIQ